MGLDWNPANKAKPGHEDEFTKIVKKLSGNVWWEKKKLEKRFEEISVPAYETLSAPRVGIDSQATQWAKQKYHESSKEQSEDEFVSRIIGNVGRHCEDGHNVARAVRERLAITPKPT